MILTFTISYGAGCHSVRNGWLDPTILGEFEQTSTLEIRTSLSLEDTPRGIAGATYPTPGDLEIIYEEYPISEGDSLTIEIYELRERRIPYQVQIQITSTGDVNLPVVGRVRAAGLTVKQFEEEIAYTLREKDILLHPDVTVNPLLLQKATFSIFGVGVSASNTAPLRAGTFPIRRPDLRVLEAINQVGGLNEFVTDVYIFRTYERGMFDLTEVNRHDDQSSYYQSRSSTKLRMTDYFPARGGSSGPRLVRQNQQEKKSIPDDVQPDPTDAYIYIDGKFVRNPKYQSSTGKETSSRTVIPTFDTPTPAVNWARLAGDTNFRVIVIPADLLRGGDPDMNIYIRPGDVIRIVSGEIGIYYVMGQVNRVGAFAFNAESITLKAAIAAAGGLAPLAWPDRCTVYRRVGAREQMIQVDLDRIFAGKDSDFFIRRDDIINVGTHPFAPFLQRIRGLTLPNPVANIGYGFTYIRNFADIDSFSVRSNPHNKPDRFPNLFP